MELVNIVYARNHSVAETVKGCKFKEEFSQLFSDVGFYNDGRGEWETKVAGKLNLDLGCKDFQRLKLEFSENQLLCEGVDLEPSAQQALCAEISSLPKQGDNQNEELATYRMQRKEVEKQNRDQCTKRTTLAQYRSIHCPEQSSLLPVSSANIRSFDRETVFIVQIFRPVSSNPKFTLGRFQYMPKRLDHVIAVLGSQPLTVLRDKIICCSDHTVLGEFSENPKLVLSSKKAKDVFKSAFFYIGDTFYNDLRYPECVDYSKDIISYAEDPSRRIGPFSSGDMNNVKFDDLKIHLGYPYLYLHQGNCEHIIVFSDLRLLDSSESHQMEDYPLICRTMQRRRIVCMICSTFTARWITTGNKRVSNDPFFFCDACFHSFNYTPDNKKIGDFKAYCYVDRTAL